jgi:hypothetical protein
MSRNSRISGTDELEHFDGQAPAAYFSLRVTTQMSASSRERLK